MELTNQGLKDLFEGLSGYRDQDLKERNDISLRSYYGFSKESQLQFLNLANVKKMTVIVRLF